MLLTWTSVVISILHVELVEIGRLELELYSCLKGDLEAVLSAREDGRSVGSALVTEFHCLHGRGVLYEAVTKPYEMIP